MKAIHLLPLVGFLLLLSMGLDAAQAQAPTEVIPYQATGYRLQIYSPGTLPSDYGSDTFDDSAFSVGDAAFGSVGGCSLQSTVVTNWPINTELVVRKTFNLPTGATNLRVMVSIDNDVEVFLNGVNISGGLVVHENCPDLDDFTFPAPDGLLRVGSNLLAVRAVDRGVESFLDLRVLASFGPTPTPTASPTPSPTVTPTPSPTLTPSPTASPTPSTTPSGPVGGAVDLERDPPAASAGGSGAPTVPYAALAGVAAAALAAAAGAWFVRRRWAR